MAKLVTVPSSLVAEGLSMPGEEPKPLRSGVKSGGYFLDERLGELRSVKPPVHTIRLNEFEVSWFREAAKGIYTTEPDESTDRSE